jgi:hypothetical protein
MPGLAAQFAEDHPAEIRVRGTVWPGVVMESHGKYYTVTEPAGRVVFRYDREAGRIVAEPMD